MRTGILLISVACTAWACSDDPAGSSGSGGMRSTGGEGGSGQGGAKATGGSSTAGASTGGAAVASGGTSSGGAIQTGGATQTGGSTPGGAGSGSGSAPSGNVNSCYGDTCPLGKCDNGGVFADVRCASVYPGPVGASSMFCAAGASGNHCLVVATATTVDYFAVTCSAGSAAFVTCPGGCKFAASQATCN